MYVCFMVAIGSVFRIVRTYAVFDQVDVIHSYENLICTMSVCVYWFRGCSTVYFALYVQMQCLNTEIS
jgi:hypothetical protein